MRQSKDDLPPTVRLPVGGAGGGGGGGASCHHHTTPAEAAASYAQRGWAILPCRPRGKEPLAAAVPRGLQDATPDPATVGSWWRRWPQANIAINLGASRLAALDIDDPALADAVLAACPGLPDDTWCQRTPRGGLHVVAAFEEDNPPRTYHLHDTQGRRLGELRSAGAYIVAWPSQTGAGAYRLLSPQAPWEPGAVRAFFTADDAEAYLLELLREVGVELQEAAPRSPAFATGRPLREGDGRNTSLYLTGRRLLREGVPPQVVAATLRGLNANPDVIAQPLPERELETVIQHVLAQPLPGNGSSPDLRGAIEGLVGSVPSSIERERSGTEIGGARWPVLAIGEALEGPEVAWVWQGFVGRGLFSDLYGLWKAGKSTLLGCLLRQMATGGELVGRPVAQGRALVITEETASKWARRAQEMGIPSGSHDLIARPFKKRPTWEEWGIFVEHVAALVRERGYSLVAFDALPNLWPVAKENEAGEVLAALRPLVTIAEAGAGVLLVRHPRKSDGAEATAGRGSGAIDGFVDVIIEFRRYQPEDREDRRRVLSVYSREEPFEVVAAWDGSTYIALGGKADVRREERLASLLSVLPTEPPGLTYEQVREAWPFEPKPGIATIKADLARLLEQGEVVREGRGVSGDPFRWRRKSVPLRSSSLEDGTDLALSLPAKSVPLRSSSLEDGTDFPAREPPHPLSGCTACRPAPFPWWEWGYLACQRGPTLIRHITDPERHLLRHLPGQREGGPFVCISEALLWETSPRYLMVRIKGCGDGWLDLREHPGVNVHHGELQRAWALRDFTWVGVQGRFPDTGPEFPDTPRVSGQRVCGQEFPDTLGVSGREFPDTDFPDRPGVSGHPERVSGHRCPACGRELAVAATGRPRRWCSDACRKRARRRGEEP